MLLGSLKGHLEDKEGDEWLILQMNLCKRGVKRLNWIQQTQVRDRRVLLTTVLELRVP
jgi:hypothetical protein